MKGANAYARKITSWAGEFRAVLVNADYRYDPDHELRDVMQHEVKGTGYPPGGFVVDVTEVLGAVHLGGISFTVGDGSVTANGLIYFRSSDGALVLHSDFGEDVTASGGGSFAVDPSRMTFADPDLMEAVRARIRQG
jgi:hypothetical protein